MANIDKGRDRWRNYSQGNAEDMRGRREKPQLVIYRPGSGPLRKSAPEEDSTNNSLDNHLKTNSTNTNLDTHLRTNFDPGSEDWRRNSKATHEPFKTLTNERTVHGSQRAQPPRRSNLAEAQSADSLSDLRRKSRKPEQAIYVPKPLAQAIAERDDFVKPSSSVSGRGSRTDTNQEEKWDKDSEMQKKEDVKRIQPSEPRNDRYNTGTAERPGLKAGEDRPRRSVEGELPLWRAESPREVRQASEPRSLPPDIHRTRDTRSMEPSGRWTGEKGQAKPPSGRRGSRDGMGPKPHPCYDTLPPRLKKKYLAENMMTEPAVSSYIGTNSETVWDGSTVTFQGSSGVNYRPHTLPLPHYPPGPQPPRPENWYQTLPTPSTRGRGRLRPEDLELERLESAVGRMSCTFPQEAASGANIDRTPGSTPPPVRTETPSAGYAVSHDRNYQHPVLQDVRNYHHSVISSNDKMYQHGGTAALPSDGRNYHHGVSTGRGLNTGTRTQTHPIHAQDARVPSHDVRVQYPHESKPTVNNQNLYSSSANPAPRQQNNASNSCQNTAPSLPATVEERTPLRELSSPVLDWSEEVELSERLEAEAAVSDAMTRSSSLVSVSDKTLTQPPRARRRRRRRRRKDKGKIEERSMSGETSPERMTGDSSGRDNNRNHTSRSGQGRNHRANSRDKNPNTSHQNKDQRGSSMDRNRRGNSQNRKRSNVSKDRNQGGYVGDRNQGDDKYNRNQHSNSHDKNIQAESQNQRRGISQDRNRHNTGQNRTQRNSSRERSGRSNSQIRNQRGGSQENQLFHRRNNTADTTSWRSSQDRETSLDRYPRNLRAPSKEKGDPWDRYHHRADSRERNNRGSGKETSLAGASRESINTRVRKEKSSQSVSVAEVGWVDKAAHKEHGRVSGRPSRPELPQEFGNQDVSSPGILVLPPPDMSVPPPSYQPVFRQLFDHNNPNKPIIVSSSPTNRNTSSTLAQNNRENEPVPDLLHSPGFVSYTGATPQLQELEEQFGNSRPSWYSPYSQSFRQAHSQRLILDIERADAELQWILSSGGILRDWNRIVYIRQFLQQSWHTLLVKDLRFSQQENVDQYMWKLLFYSIIELLRKSMAEDTNPENKELYKNTMLSVIEEGTVFLDNLLVVLEQTYNVDLDSDISMQQVINKNSNYISIVLVAAQKIFLFLGDLARYKEQVNESSNFGKSRQCYLKAHHLNPKNGRPYYQLAILAVYGRRKLDAVYYYTRSIMASNPFHSAREKLLALFDESRKKYEQLERKRREEREGKMRERMKEKEGAGLRREFWVHPEGGRRLHITTSTLQEHRRAIDSEEEELAGLSSAEVNKRFVISYLNVQGKLFTKIGMETFQESAVQMLREFRALLQHSPVPLNANRFLQLLALNMFAIENTQPKDSLEAGYRSALQESALVLSLQMFNLILEKCVILLKEQLENTAGQLDLHNSRLIVSEDLQVLLPAVKVWCDWLVCHSTVWNPPPSCQDYRVGPAGDAWVRMASFVNLLERLNYGKLRMDEEPHEGWEMVRLPEDSTLSEFTPLKSIIDEPCYISKDVDMEEACVVKRVRKIVFFGTVWLCGEDPPVLKLQKYNESSSEYVSVVASSSQESPSSPPEGQSDSDLRVESFSEDEAGGDTPETEPSAGTPAEIRSLLHRKEELERRQQRQERHRQRVQTILRETVVSVEIEVKPHYLVPDTNCFIDYLPQLQKISQATTSQHQLLYTLMVPLVVIKELEGLARGGRDRDFIPLAHIAPEHAARVAESAKTALIFLRSRLPGVRCVTSRGAILAPTSCAMEEETDLQQGNDDRILTTSLSLCKIANDEDTKPGEPRRLLRDVVLLTEDRNLRVKALALHVPVREVGDFMKWAGLG